MMTAVSFPWCSFSTLFRASWHVLYHSIWERKEKNNEIEHSSLETAMVDRYKQLKVLIFQQKRYMLCQISSKRNCHEFEKINFTRYTHLSENLRVNNIGVSSRRKVYIGVLNPKCFLQLSEVI